MLTLSVELKGVDALMKDNAEFRQKLPANVLNSIRRQIRRTITTVKQDIRTKSRFGERIWGQKPKGLDKLVTLIKAQSTGLAIRTGIKLKGIPAMIESGGKIQAHKIQGVPWMSFQIKGIGIRIKTVNHPGSAVRGHGFAERALERDADLVNKEVRIGIDKLIGDTFGQPG